MIHIIKDALSEDKAESLLENINNMSSDMLHTAYYLLEEGPTYINSSISHSVYKLNNDPLLVDSLRRNLFTYRFQRTQEHEPQCSCFICDFKKKDLWGDVKHIIERNTGYNNVEPQENFVSVYNEGDFLSAHHDGGNGDLAFILNLTKNWRPEYGGLLHVLQEDGTYKAINPEFNSLVIMELPEGGASHFVSEVTKYAPNPRIAISGWYTDRKGNFYEPYEQ